MGLMKSEWIYSVHRTSQNVFKSEPIETIKKKKMIIRFSRHSKQLLPLAKIAEIMRECERDAASELHATIDNLDTIESLKFNVF